MTLHNSGAVEIPGLGLAHLGRSLTLQVPQFFARADFMQWLNSHNVATWHERGEPCAGEYSDVFVLVDPSLSGCGTESDTMPQDLWDSIVAACRHVFVPQGGEHIVVRLQP